MTEATTPLPGTDPVPVLEMRGIGKTFPGVRALDGVHLTAHAGRVVALLGENGAGKSTLINVLSGVFPAYDGEVLVDGEPVTLHAPAEAQRLGIATIHQELNLVPDMSVSDNVWLGRERSRAGWVERREQAREAARLLGRVGLEIDPRKPVRQFRVAEQQLIEVAKALSIDTRVLIMDEPTSALDVVAQRSLMVQIKELQKQLGFAVVFVTHDMSLVSHFSDKLVVMYAGQVVEFGDTRAVFDAPQHPYSAGLLDAFPSIRGPKVPLTGIPGSPPNLAGRADHRAGLLGKPRAKPR